MGENPDRVLEGTPSRPEASPEKAREHEAEEGGGLRSVSEAVALVSASVLVGGGDRHAGWRLARGDQPVRFGHRWRGGGHRCPGLLRSRRSGGGPAPVVAEVVRWVTGRRIEPEWRLMGRGCGDAGAEMGRPAPSGRRCTKAPATPPLTAGASPRRGVVSPGMPSTVGRSPQRRPQQNGAPTGMIAPAPFAREPGR